MAIEGASYPSGLDPATYGPFGTSDPAEGDDFIKNTREILKNTFANISGAVTATQDEMNYLDLTALGTAQNSKAITVGATGGCDASAVTWSNLGTVTTVDINGGSVDGASVGTASPSSGIFTVLQSTVNFSLATGSTVTAILDEDAMSTNSATALATQQSIKAYVDAQTGAISSGVIAQLQSNYAASYTVTGTYADAVSQSITPSSASNKVKVTITGYITLAASQNCTALWKVQKAGVDLLSEVSHYLANGAAEVEAVPISVSYVDSPATTEAKTYALQMYYTGTNAPTGTHLSIVLEEITV